MPPTQDERERQRLEYRRQIDTALDEEEDPLAIYHQFVQWTIKNYGENEPSSGLLDLLEEVTRKYREDSLYKADLRYLKLWTLYATHVERHSALSIFKYLMTNEIGISYSLLYEEYANALEQAGRKQDADTIYRRGIKKQVRPLERLKTKYKEFQARIGSSSSAPPLNSKPSKSSSATSNGTQRASSKTSSSTAIASNSTKTSSSTTTVSNSTKTSSSSTTANLIATTSTAASRHAVMITPQPPGKRPEKLRFNFPLLFSDGIEYSIQEARARSMGLLGKKWGPPAASEMRISTTQVVFNDDGHKTIKNMGRRKSLMGASEPTITINTKEALADVFGMYNSPDKTNIFPGSKHAPVKKVEPATPIVPPRLTFTRENENAGQNLKTPVATFRPFVDETVQPSRVTPAAKFQPFVDPDARKTPLVTPRPALVAKDAITPRPALGLKPVPEEKSPEAVFSKVFAPAKPVVHQHVFAEEAAEIPSAKPQHDNTKDSHDSRAFRPFVDKSAKTPFKVFSRPSENNSGAHVQNPFNPKTPKAVFTPFTDKTPAFTPFRDDQNAPAPLTDKTPSALSVKRQPAFAPSTFKSQQEEEEEEYEEYGQEQVGSEHLSQQEEYEEEEVVQYEAPLENEEMDQGYEEQNYHRVPPLSGRFGQFNVMTPIVERTCEFTMSTRGGITPKDNYYETAEDGGSPRSNVFSPPRLGEREALHAAEQLAAELREEEESDAEEFESSQAERSPAVEERTASLSLGEKLALSRSFRPSNPCNPFDASTMNSLLSRMPSDAQFFDLRDQTSEQLDQLQKFVKRSRKTDFSTFALNLNGHRFVVSDKLGEGGFGTVFKARDLGKGSATGDDEDSDLDDDDDDENTSFVAIKVVKPRNTWEYHVLRRLHTTLPSSLRRSLIIPYGLYAFADESFLILDLCTQGMLLNIVNNAVSAGVSQQGACLDELLVMFFTIELLRLVEGIHNAGFIHGDLKIDNCLLRLEEIPGGVSAWSSDYQPSGEGGWSCKGLKVIDFGRTIDTRMFPSGQQFIADWTTDERDCFEMREQRPWTYQTDYFGLAGIVYCMLFGKYIQASSIANVDGRRKISTPMKRYWQSDIWNRLFDVLLNPCLVKPNGALPVCDELTIIRKDMETWLQANCNRSSNTLKGLLKKVEKAVYMT